MIPLNFYIMLHEFWKYFFLRFADVDSRLPGSGNLEKKVN